MQLCSPNIHGSNLLKNVLSNLPRYTWRNDQDLMVVRADPTQKPAISGSPPCWSSPDSANKFTWWLLCKMNWLVVSTPLKNIIQSIGMIIPNSWENKKCSKPPTSELSTDYQTGPPFTFVVFFFRLTAGKTQKHIPIAVKKTRVSIMKLFFK